MGFHPGCVVAADQTTADQASAVAVAVAVADQASSLRTDSHR
jgi:hypothetical protein